MDEGDDVADAESVDQSFGHSAGGGLGDQCQRDIPLGAQLGQGLEQGRDALQRRIGRRHRHDASGDSLPGIRRKDLRLDAQRNDIDALGVDAELARDVDG